MRPGFAVDVYVAVVPSGFGKVKERCAGQGMEPKIGSVQIVGIRHQSEHHQSYQERGQCPRAAHTRLLACFALGISSGCWLVVVAIAAIGNWNQFLGGHDIGALHSV